MNSAEFCEYYIVVSLSLIFLSNSTLVLLLGIPYLAQPIFGQGEVVQIITSSATVVFLFFLFLCRSRVVPCFKVSKATAFVTLAALNMLGACCLTTYGEGNECCEFDNSQNPKCYRRPDVDLPLAWLSTAVALTGVVASFVLHLYDDAAHTWPRKDDDRPRLTRRDSLELAKMERSSNGKDITEYEEEAPAYGPPPPYESSAIPPSSYVLPSIPLRKREMNKLGLTVITDISMHPPFEFCPPETEPRKRWRGRGRDIWERKPLGTSVKLGRE